MRRIWEVLPRSGILHRLDKDTSGLLLVAKICPCAYSSGPGSAGSRDNSRISRAMHRAADSGWHGRCADRADIRRSEPAWPLSERGRPARDSLSDFVKVCGADFHRAASGDGQNPPDQGTHGANSTCPHRGSNLRRQVENTRRRVKRTDMLCYARFHVRHYTQAGSLSAIRRVSRHSNFTPRCPWISSTFYRPSLAMSNRARNRGDPGRWDRMLWPEPESS